MDDIHSHADPRPEGSPNHGGARTDEPTESPATRPADTPWLRATAADVKDLDFEIPIAGSTSATTYELSEQYRRAAQSPATGAGAPDTPEARVFTMLSAVTGMHLKADEREEPYGPLMTLADGSRTAVLADFRNGHVDLLAEIAMRCRNPVLKARLADVCWVLDRRRGRLGAVAIAAYIDTIESVEREKLKFVGGDGGALEHANVLLLRALLIGRTIGWKKPETIRARKMVVRLRERATELRSGVPTLWFAKLDLDFGLSDPTEVATAIEQVIASPVSADVHNRAALWRLAARGYNLAKRDADNHRCQAQAADLLAAEAEHIFSGQAQMSEGSAMRAALMMSQAIAQLHGIPAAKERRTVLRHRLVDIQARIPDEMSVYTFPWDIKVIEAKVEEAFGQGLLLDQLFHFAVVANSPDSASLVKQAKELMQQHPISALLPAIHFDNEGKTIHRSAGAGSLCNPSNSAVQREIAQTESIRRNVTAAMIDMARSTIMAQHFLREDILVSLFQQSPFVPRDLVATFSRGFLRFFQGDFASATYLLTPLLENSLRHVLKSYGHDVTIFDDATQTQKDRAISSLFEQMREELDAVFTRPITTDIENVFLNHPGPHLRHDIAHGLAHDGTPYGPDAVYGCWLIFRLCLLPLFPYREQLSAVIH